MTTVDDLMTQLEAHGSEQTRKTYARHGIIAPMFGVSIADLKTIAKKIKGNQPLALELYDTGNYDAMYLAGIVASGAKMSKQQLNRWATAGSEAICSYTVPGVAAESPHARELALKWIDSKKPGVALTGWATYGLIVAVTPDEDLDIAEIKVLVDRVVKEIHSAPNKVRYMMNSFVISVGTYFKPLLAYAKRAAKTIGPVSVDMGDTACKVPLATEYIQKIEAAGRVGKKRKSTKC